MESIKDPVDDVEVGEPGPPADDDDLESPLLRKSSMASSFIMNKKEKHTAIIGANVATIESLDYELIETELFKQDWRSRTQREIFQYVFLKWTFVFLVGLLTGVVGFGINMAVENISSEKFAWTSRLMKENRYLSGFLVYAGSNVALVFFSAILVVYISPAAAGSGIPEVMAYLNGVFGSVGSVAGGLIVGKEGPLVHIGSCIASIIGQGGSRKYHLTWRWLRFFKNDRDRRDLVTCGAAAGVAAAFRAPVGGVLFALEGATSWWRSALLWRSFFTTAVVAVVVRIGTAWCSGGRCGLFGEGDFIIFDTNGVESDYGLLELFPVIILGVIGGVLGGLFNYLNSRVVVFYSEWLSKTWPSAKVLQACIIALITSMCSYGLPLMVRCMPCPDSPSESFSCSSHDRAANYKSFHCPPGQYNDLGTLFFNTNDDATRNLLSTGTVGEFRKSSLLIYLASSYILALITFGIAVPSGLFVPSILCGAVYGRIVGEVMLSVEGARDIDGGVYAILGAASFLGGSMRMTVSVCVILLELTNNLTMLPLMMLVLLISKTVGDSFNDAIFDLHVRLKGIPFLVSNPEPFMRHLTAADAITSSLVKFNLVEKVGTIVDTLENTRHNAFAVMDQFDTVFHGLVLRAHILVLLEKRQFLADASCPSDTTKLTCVDFAKPGSGKQQKIEGLELSTEELDMYLDLSVVTNTSPYTVVETMSLAKAFTLFRQLGLRHLCVMSKSQKVPPILGLLTRHDFMPGYLYSIYPHLR